LRIIVDSKADSQIPNDNIVVDTTWASELPSISSSSSARDASRLYYFATIEDITEPITTADTSTILNQQSRENVSIVQATTSIDRGISDNSLDIDDKKQPVLESKTDANIGSATELTTSTIVVEDGIC
jgi:hypothetical protein